MTYIEYTPTSRFLLVSYPSGSVAIGHGTSWFSLYKTYTLQVLGGNIETDVCLLLPRMTLYALAMRLACYENDSYWEILHIL